MTKSVPLCNTDNIATKVYTYILYIHINDEAEIVNKDD